MTEHALNLPAEWSSTNPVSIDPANPNQTPSLNRREFLVYAWSMALALAVAQSAAGVYLFMRPRFRAGEFGGRFEIGAASALPETGAAPQGNPEGKFWLVNTEDGPRALYMVCTHLGCLYKWYDDLNHFRCPCHSSEFSREGKLLHGPATRGLDQFVVQVVDGGQIVAQTEEDGDTIRPPVVSTDDARLIIDTGKRILGRP